MLIKCTPVSMASPIARILPVHCASDFEFGEYLTNIQEFQRNICVLSETEQNNIQSWIERLAAPTEVTREKSLRNEYAQRLSHLLKQSRIEYPFTEAPPPLEGNLKPLNDCSRRLGKLGKAHDNNKNAENKEKDKEKATETSQKTSSLTKPYSRIQENQPSSFHSSPLPTELSEGRTGSSKGHEDETAPEACSQDKSGASEGHPYSHKQIQRIRLSPRQKNKLRTIQEEGKNLEKEYGTGTGDFNSTQTDLNITPQSNRICNASFCRKTCELMSPPSNYPRDTFDPKDFGESSFVSTKTNPLFHQANNLRAGTTGSVLRSASPEFGEKVFLSIDGSRYGNTSVSFGHNDKGIKNLGVENEDNWLPHPSDNPHVKTCISCGKILKEESDMKRHKASYQHTDFFKTIWEKGRSVIHEKDARQIEQMEDQQCLDTSRGGKDDVQLVLSSIDPDISLREFVLLFAPMFPDEGKLMKKATGEQFLKFLKNIDTVYADKLEKAAQLMRIKHQSQLEDYKECERRIAHQRVLLEAEIRSILPDFDREQYLKDGNYTAKAFETAKGRLLAAESGFQEARKHQHAELQAVKLELGKVRRENLTLKTELEALKQNCEIQQSEIGALPVLLEKYRNHLQVALKYHQELVSSDKLIAEFCGKPKNGPDQGKST